MDKTVNASRCVMNEIVLPNDVNSLGNLKGGRLLHLMDICAAISSQRHTNRVCVTAAVDNVEFNSAIRGGEVITLKSQVNRTFNSSMEIEINVWAENTITKTRRKSNRAFYTFVAMDETNRPTKAPPIIPETDLEKKKYEDALRRREVRLLLAGRLNLDDAPALKEDLLAYLRESKEDDDEG